MAEGSLDKFLEIDNQRERDGFPRKIKISKVLVGRGRAIVVPYVEEEQLVHGEFEPGSGHGQSEAGHGQGEVGDVIHKRRIAMSQGGQGKEGEGGQGKGEHGVEIKVYELGRELSKKLKLPNLKDKSKKFPSNEYFWDLTDRHIRSGQLLDKKETLRRVIRTNAVLGRFDINNPDVSRIVIAPRDRVYRVLSRERVWKSKAVAFFLRDYSASMQGEPTETTVAQHLMLYACLLFIYDKMVIPRFVVHDSEAREVQVEDYFTLGSGGGTSIVSGYRKINEVVESENLVKDYNIYIFQGTDGDDFSNEKETIPEIEKILGYANRMGVIVLKRSGTETTFENYIKAGDFMERKDVFRMHTMSDHGVTDEQNEEAISILLAED